MSVARSRNLVVESARRWALGLLAAALAAVGCVSTTGPGAGREDVSGEPAGEASSPDRVITREELQRRGGVALEDALGRSSAILVVTPH